MIRALAHAYLWAGALLLTGVIVAHLPAVGRG